MGAQTARPTKLVSKLLSFCTNGQGKGKGCTTFQCATPKFHTSTPLLSTQDALERAYQADVEGHSERAIKLYTTGVQAIREGLKLPIVGTGEVGRPQTGLRRVFPATVLQLWHQLRLQAIRKGLKLRLVGAGEAGGGI